MRWEPQQERRGRIGCAELAYMLALMRHGYHFGYAFASESPLTDTLRRIERPSQMVMFGHRYG